MSTKEINHKQSGGRINPNKDQILYYHAATLHFLANKNSYTNSGKIKPMIYRFVQTKDGDKFPISSRYRKLYKSSKLRETTQTFIFKPTKNSKTVTKTTFLQSGHIKGDEKMKFLKAIANNIWGFLKQKEGDIEKSDGGSLIKSHKKTLQSNLLPEGYTVSATYARKAIELITTYILLEAGFTLEQMYDSENSIGHHSDYSLYLKNILIKITSHIGSIERRSIVKTLKNTPTDRILSVLKRKYPELITSENPPPSNKLFEALETIRYFGNVSSHGGTPENWEPKLSDDDLEEVSSSLMRIVSIFLKFFLHLEHIESNDDIF